MADEKHGSNQPDLTEMRVSIVENTLREWEPHFRFIKQAKFLLAAFVLFIVAQSGVAIFVFRRAAKEIDDLQESVEKLRGKNDQLRSSLDERAKSLVELRREEKDLRDQVNEERQMLLRLIYDQRQSRPWPSGALVRNGPREPPRLNTYIGRILQVSDTELVIEVTEFQEPQNVKLQIWKDATVHIGSDNHPNKLSDLKVGMKVDALALDDLILTVDVTK